jgi:hypothetical protein
MQIPPCFVAHCEFCRQQLDIRAEDVSHCIAGWVEPGVGDDIELSDIKQPEPTNRWAHDHCVKRAMLARGRED